MQLSGILPHVYLIHYLGNSVTVPTFLRISSKNGEKLKAGGPNQSGGLGKFFERNKRETLIREQRVGVIFNSKTHNFEDSIRAVARHFTWGVYL